MSKRITCKKCYKKLNKLGNCVKCGWSYGKEFNGQQKL